MSDDFESELRETLGNAVPTPPETQSWAAGARAYTHRVRRTRAVIAVGAVAVVAAAAIVIPNVLASPDNHVAGPSDTTSGTKSPPPVPPLAHPYTCPSRSGGEDGATPADGTVVSAGAVLVRLCPVEGQVARWSAPTDALVTGVDELTNFVNALPDAHGLMCPLLPDLTYTLTFQYPDGRAVSLNGEVGGCGFVTPVFRTGGAELLRDYLSRLHDQRAHFAPPQTQIAAPTCPVRPDHVQAVLVDGRSPGLTRAIVCSYATWAGPNLASSRGTLSPQQVAGLNADIAAHATHRLPPPVCFHPTTTLTIFGINAWGDRVELADGCGFFTFTDRQGTWYWTPSAQISAMLESVQHASGRVSGQLLGVGGPAPGLSLGWAGTIHLTRPGSKVVLTAGPHGFFAGQLDPGRYRVIGYSPSYNDGKAACNPAHPFVNVLPHQSVRVDVYCQMK